MAHKWEEVEPKCPADLMKDKRRVCTECGKWQSFVNEGVWMRITRRWVPLVGRCSGKKKVRGPKNHYKEPVIMTCDECDQIPPSKILWQEKVERRLWCPNCWPY